MEKISFQLTYLENQELSYLIDKLNQFNTGIDLEVFLNHLRALYRHNTQEVTLEQEGNYDKETIYSYYFSVVSDEDIDTKAPTDFIERTEELLTYLYSSLIARILGTHSLSSVDFYFSLLPAKDGFLVNIYPLS